MSVEMAEGVGNLEDDFERSSLRKGFLLDELSERDPLDELHGDVESFFPGPLPIEFHNVGMVCHPDDLRLF